MKDTSLPAKDISFSPYTREMIELREGYCFPRPLFGVNVALACADFVIAACAFYQLLRIQSRSSQHGWTRQKVFHLMIGSSNLGYFIYFVSTLVATCKGWLCWSHSCGFVLMTFPKILFFAAFLLLLSFWIDLCHPENDEDEDEECSFHESLFDSTLTNPSIFVATSRRRWLPFRLAHIRFRQKIVILVTLLVSILMIAAAVLMWIGIGKNLINPELVARVYVAALEIATLLLGVALACYGLVLCLRMRRIRSERASSEMWKIGGLAGVSILCFTPSALIGFLTDTPLLYHWHPQLVNGLSVSIFVIVFYFIGSSVPAAFLLWVMRELPPSVSPQKEEDDSLTIAFVPETTVTAQHPQRWTIATTSSQNQISRPSPI